MFIILFILDCNAKVNELKLISDIAHEQSILCEGAHPKWLCIVSGAHLQWNRSLVQRFHSHDPAGTALIIEGRSVAVLLDVSYTSEGEKQLTSVLYSMETASSTSLPTNVTCGTDTSDLMELRTTLSGM